MSLKNTPTTYGLLARALHWSMAALIFILLALGLYMTSLPDSDAKWGWYDWHKAFGMLVFFLLAFRLLWRHLSPPPALPTSMTTAEKALAHLGHLALYLCMLLLPLSGYLDSAWGGYHISFFGWFDIPLLFAKDKALFDLAVTVHWLTAYALIALLAAHIGAALLHHFIKKDGVLLRMLGKE